MSRKGMLGAVSVKELKGVVGDLMEKCSGRDGRKWLVAAKRFLRGDDPWPIFWRTSFTTEVGVFADLRGFFEQMGHCRMTDEAQQALRSPGSSFRLESEYRRIRIVDLTPRDLGFKDGVPLQRLVEKAAGKGLVPCPSEVALHMPYCFKGAIDRLQYVITAPIVIKEGTHYGSLSVPRLFHVKPEGDGVCLAVAQTDWFGPDDRVVFCLPDFAVRWTVTLGECAASVMRERLAGLEIRNFLLQDRAAYALSPEQGFKTAKSKREVDLVAVSVGELGFLAPTTYDLIRDRAESLGLEECPREVAPALVLQQEGRFGGIFDHAEYLVAAEPNEPETVKYDSVLLEVKDGWLGGVKADVHHPVGTVFIFVKPHEDEAEE